MFDLRKIRAEIAWLIAECIHLKSVLRVRWTKPMAEEQQRLVRVRRQLTDLFVVLAFARKKLHVRTPPRELGDRQRGEWDAAAYHRTIAMRLLPDYSTNEARP